MAESRLASSDEIVVGQVKLNAKTKTRLNQHKRGWMSGKNGQIKENSTLNWRSTSTKISIKLQMFYAEVRTKDGLFYNFVENIINKKSYIARALRDIWSLVMILKFSNCTRLRARWILRTLKASLVPLYITKCTSVHTIFYACQVEERERPHWGPHCAIQLGFRHPADKSLSIEWVQPKVIEYWIVIHPMDSV